MGEVNDTSRSENVELKQAEDNSFLAKYKQCATVYNFITLLLIANIIGQLESIEFVKYIEFGTEHYVSLYLSSLKYEFMTQLLTVLPEAHTVISLVVLGVMTIFYIIIGFLAYRRVWTAYMLGWGVFSLDIALTFVRGNYISGVVHLILFVVLCYGFRVHNKLNAIAGSRSKRADRGDSGVGLGVVKEQLMKSAGGAGNAQELAGCTMGGGGDEEDNSVDLSVINRHALLKQLIQEESHYRYKSHEKIAKGGMGIVYSAKDNSLSRTVALKQISVPNRNQTADTLSFIEEARVNALLEHPNIIPVYDIGLDNEGEPYYTMKRVKGEPLSYIVKQLNDNVEEYTKKFNRMNLLQIFMKVCDAISYAHSRGIIHLDIKPENILVGDYGETLVMDWGISQKIGQESPHHSIAFDMEGAGQYNTIDISHLLKSSGAVQNSVMGTPMYMAPEQITNEEGSLDERSDIYALGSLLYNLLTLKPPHEMKQGDASEKMKNIMELLKKKVDGHYVPPVKRFPELHIPSELNAIVNKSMDISKENRYQTVSDMIKDIMNFLEDRSISAQRDSIIKRAKRFYRKNTALCSSVFLTVLFMTIFGFAISFYLGKVSRGSKVIYSQMFTDETLAQSQTFAQSEFSVDGGSGTSVESDGSIKIPARRAVWLNKEVIGSLEMMVEFSWQHQQASPLYIGINIKDRSNSESSHYFAAMALLGGELCKLGKQPDSAIAETHPYKSNSAVSSRYAMEGFTRYRALIRHEDDVTELYINGTLVAQNYDPMFLTGKMNGKIMIKTDSDSLRLHSLQITKLKEPTLVSPAKLADKLFALQKFDAAVDVYLDVFNTYEEEELREEALYKATLSCYSLGDYPRFDSLLNRFVKLYNHEDMADSLYSIKARRNWSIANYSLALDSVERISDEKRRASCLIELLAIGDSSISTSDTEYLIKLINALPDMVTLNLKRIGLKYIRKIRQDRCLELLLDNNNIYSLNILEKFTDLKKLSLADNPIFALKPLARLELIELSLANTKVKDLSHIQGMSSLRILDITGIVPNTFTPLKQLDLDELSLSLEPTSSMAFLKDIGTLKKVVINGKLYSLENGKLAELNTYLKSTDKSPTLQNFLRGSE